MGKITERRIYAVPNTAFVTDGTKAGRLTVADASLFRVGQKVFIDSSAQEPLELKIKRILPDGVTIYLGPLDKGVLFRTDISDYLVADGAFIFANEQERPSIPVQEVERITYEEEPVVARRVIIVDKNGKRIDDTNRLPVEATIDLPLGGTPTIFNVNAPLKDTEYSQALPSNTLQFSIRARNSAKLQYSFTSGTTNTTFLTVVPGNIYLVKDLDLVSTTLYFEANKDNTVVEIMTWT